MLDDQLKPEIHVYFNEAIDDSVLAPLFYGLEEEGIPYHKKLVNGKDACSIAYDAANTSPLNVGIGYDEKDIVIHYKNLKPEEPYLVLKRFQAVPKDKLKDFGSNASRLVKGIPLKAV